MFQLHMLVRLCLTLLASFVLARSRLGQFCLFIRFFCGECLNLKLQRFLGLLASSLQICDLLKQLVALVDCLALDCQKLVLQVETCRGFAQDATASALAVVIGDALAGVVGQRCLRQWWVLEFCDGGIRRQSRSRCGRRRRALLSCFRFGVLRTLCFAVRELHESFLDESPNVLRLQRCKMAPEPVVPKCSERCVLAAVLALAQHRVLHLHEEFASA
mmetsp:Transcript_12485/g.34299  ORF Transcript_12485/g.34299 Transcript_12485/m.34299 type:complete len:217 (+) Transcript_12485:1429-2079(+)